MYPFTYTHLHTETHTYRHIYMHARTPLYMDPLTHTHICIRSHTLKHTSLTWPLASPHFPPFVVVTPASAERRLHPP